MRTRTFIDYVEPGSYHAYATDKSGKVLQDSVTATRSQLEHDVMLDFVIPNFRVRSAKGQIFNNPMSRTYISVSGGVGTRNARNSDGTWNFVGTGNVIPYLMGRDNVVQLPSVVDTSGGNALLQAWANVDKTPYDFSEDLAELGETLKYLKKPFESFYKVLKPYRRRRDKLMKKGLSKAAAHSKAWLEYRFAITPMAMSAYNAGDALANWKKQVRPNRRTARGMYKSNAEKVFVKVVGYRTYVQRLREECVTRGTVLYEQPGGTLSLSHSLGLRAKNIPATAWAICPYSWLIDRFVDISSLVDAYVNLFDPSIKPLLACTTQNTESTFNTNLVSDKTPDQIVTNSVTPLVEVRRTFTRNPAPLNDVPLPRATLRSLKSIVNLSDMMALILQRLR